MYEQTVDPAREERLGAILPLSHWECVLCWLQGAVKRKHLQCFSPRTCIPPATPADLGTHLLFPLSTCGVGLSTPCSVPTSFLVLQFVHRYLLSSCHLPDMGLQL